MRADTVMHDVQVSELKVQLSQAKTQQDKLRAEAAAASAARDAALERVSTLKQEVEQLQFMLDEVHAARSDSPGKVSLGAWEAISRQHWIDSLCSSPLKYLWPFTESTSPVHGAKSAFGFDPWTNAVNLGRMSSHRERAGSI